MKFRNLIIIAAIAALICPLAGCANTKKIPQKQTIAVFGGSFSVVPASEEATGYWAGQLGADITKYGVGGAGFSNLSQWDHQHIQWQIDQACKSEAPVYDTYILWASTNDFQQVNALAGDAWDYTEYDNFDTSKLATQCGGINYAIKRIREKAPSARILFMTSTKCFNHPASGTDVNYGGGEKVGLNSFVDKQILCCQRQGVPYLDLFTLAPFNDDNYTEYTESDHLHLNKAGYRAIRDLQVQFIRGGKTICGPLPTFANHNSSDWPQYNRYAAANAEVKTAPVAVLYGDSITDNWARFHPEWLAEHNFLGRGISGQTTVEALARFRQDVVALHPKYVAILYGTNDLAENIGKISIENIAGNIASLVDLALANGITPILCTVLPVASYAWRPQLGPQASRVETLNKFIRDIAAEKNVPLCDYWTAMNDGQGGLSKELSGDGVHPNPDAYRLMEAELLKYIK